MSALEALHPSEGGTRRSSDVCTSSCSPQLALERDVRGNTARLHGHPPCARPRASRATCLTRTIAVFKGGR